MDTTILQNGCEEIQYILNDSEFLLESSDVPIQDSSDLLYTDGSQTYLVNSHFMNDSEQTLVLEGEDFNQLFINNECGQILVTSEDNLIEGQFITDSEFVQCVVKDDNESQILYLTDDSIIIKDEEMQEQLEHMNDQPQTIELEDLFQQSENFSNQHGYQYAILKDGKLHIQSFDNKSAEMEMSPETNSDTNLITGKNLITGQTVSLENYFKKRHSSIIEHNTQKNGNRSRKTKFCSLLNRTFRLGASVNGKQLVGKVVQVKTNTEKKGQTRIGGSSIAITYEQLRKNLKFKNVDDNSEISQHLHQTLSGLMEIETVEKKLLHKKLFVMVEEKNIQSNKNAASKKVYYAGGSLQPEGEIEEKKWSFIGDFLLQNNNGSRKTQNNIEQMFSHVEIQDTTKIKLMITHEKNNKTQIRVILDGVMRERDFDHELQYEKNSKEANSELLNEQWHVAVGQENVFPCSFNGCNRCFSTEAFMLKHFQTHEAETAQSSLEDHLKIVYHKCSICSKAFSNLNDLTVHKKKHSPGKIFRCDMCGKSFSRCSNLQRHMTVHHKGPGDIFKCKICGCSYHFVSSLTRHMVQNHILGQKGNKEKQ